MVSSSSNNNNDTGVTGDNNTHKKTTKDSSSSSSNINSNIVNNYSPLPELVAAMMSDSPLRSSSKSKSKRKGSKKGGGTGANKNNPDLDWWDGQNNNIQPPSVSVQYTTVSKNGGVKCKTKKTFIPSSSSSSSKPLKFQSKESFQKYLHGLAAITSAAKSGNFDDLDAKLKAIGSGFTNITDSIDSTTPTVTAKNNDNNTNDNDDDKSNTNTTNILPLPSPSSINANVGPGITSQSCSDADMKALMNMFVDIMGMSSNFDNSHINNDSEDESLENMWNIRGKSLKNIVNIRHHHNNISGDGSSDDDSSSNNNVDLVSMNAAHASFSEFSEHISKLQNNNSNSSSNNSSKKKATSSSKKLNPNMIPPPPGGWPPGAAAAAAALAAASSGATSVTVPLNGGSISLPVSMFASTHLNPLDNNRNYNNNSSSRTSDSDNIKSSPEWMKDAFRFINQHHDFSDDASDISARYGSGDEYDYDDEYDFDDDDDDDDFNHYSTYIKPPPQDRKSGEATISRSSSEILRQSNITAEQAAAELLREEEEAALNAKEEGDKVKRAAKKREKKNRKKEKARREAAIKAAQTAQKKRENLINSWRSKIASALLGNECHKIDSLISDHPFKDDKHDEIDPDILEELDSDYLSFEEEVKENMLWLLSSCIATSRNGKAEEGESRCKLGSFVMTMSLDVIFNLRQDGRSALHTACLVGDYYFVKLLTEKIKEENIQEQFCLDFHCGDLGWSPLHYAAAAGWNDVVELLLASRCDFEFETDPKLTCLIGNDKGVTVKELLELIQNETYVDKLNFNKESFQEMIQVQIKSRASDCLPYVKSIKGLIERLNDVEANGYSPIQKIQGDPSNDKDTSVDTGAVNLTESKSEVDKASKKKKKKKKKSQTSNNDKVESSVALSTASLPKRGQDEDLVSMLLAMGFAEDQINAAIDACGGTDRATADDLVEWILSGVASDSNNQSNENSKGRENNLKTRDNNISKASEMEAKKTREAEAKAAAERLAAKREEQRRIRREWNNREQLRQQEEAKAKLAEEVERKRRLEMEKAKLTTQRLLQERAATAEMMYQDPNTAILGNTGFSGVNISDTGSSPLFPGTMFQVGNVNNLQSDTEYYPDMHALHHAFDPAMQQASTLPYEPATQTLLTSNGNEFPVLGTNKSSSHGKKLRSKNADSPPSSKGRKKNETSSEDKRLVGQSTNAQVARSQGRSHESNPFGEIRATAKSFVPSNFTPSTSPQPPPGLDVPKSLPPGLTQASKPSDPLLASSLLSDALPNNILPRNTTTRSSVLPVSLLSDSGSFDNSSSIDPIPIASQTTIGLSFGDKMESHRNDDLIDSIWGAAPAASTSTIPANTLGGFPFNFSENTDNSNAGDDTKKKEYQNNSSNMWGNGGGGSIW